MFGWSFFKAVTLPCLLLIRSLRGFKLTFADWLIFSLIIALTYEIDV
jgi:hypothetical protein